MHILTPPILKAITKIWPKVIWRMLKFIDSVSAIIYMYHDLLISDNPLQSGVVKILNFNKE